MNENSASALQNKLPNATIKQFILITLNLGYS